MNCGGWVISQKFSFLFLMDRRIYDIALDIKILEGRCSVFGKLHNIRLPRTELRVVKDHPSVTQIMPMVVEVHPEKTL